MRIRVNRATKIVLVVVLLYYVIIIYMLNSGSTNHISEFTDLNYIEISRVFANHSQNSLQLLEEKDLTTNHGREFRVAMTIKNTQIILRNHNGGLVLNKSINNFLIHPDIAATGDTPNKKTKSNLVEGNFLRRWNKEKEILTFLHIGKNGGTAFRNALIKTKLKRGCKWKPLYYTNQSLSASCPGHVPCVCIKHFDWTLIQRMLDDGHAVAPLVLLRDPIRRAVSHFYFLKQMPWSLTLRMRNQSLTQFLDDPVSLLESRDVWQDGQAGVSWLAGTHIGNWVVKLTLQEVNEREKRNLNWGQMLETTINHYHDALWVGIIENLQESLELLYYQTGLSVRMGHANRNLNLYPEPTPAEIEKLRDLMPMDVFFYEYAKQIHKVRWNMYKHIKNMAAEKEVEIVLPPVIKGCKSTRYNLNCGKGKIFDLPATL